jgi:hypothetical protein
MLAGGRDIFLSSRSIGLADRYRNGSRLPGFRGHGAIFRTRFAAPRL